MVPVPFFLPYQPITMFDSITFARAFQVGAGLLHVETNRVQLVAGGLGEAIAGRKTRARRPGDSQSRLGDYPSVARASGHADWRLLRVALLDYLDRGSFVFRPGNDDMRGGLDLEQRHSFPSCPSAFSSNNPTRIVSQPGLPVNLRPLILSFRGLGRLACCPTLVERRGGKKIDDRLPIGPKLYTAVGV